MGLRAVFLYILDACCDCRAAVAVSPGGGAEAAMEWLLLRLDEPGINDPVPAVSSTPAPAAASVASVASVEATSMLTGMGFSDQQAQAALKVRVLDREGEWLLCLPRLLSCNPPAPQLIPLLRLCPWPHAPPRHAPTVWSVPLTGCSLTWMTWRWPWLAWRQQEQQQQRGRLQGQLQRVQQQVNRQLN